MPKPRAKPCASPNKAGKKKLARVPNNQKNDEKLINTAKEIEKNEEDVDAADVPEATHRPPIQSARSPWSNRPNNAVLPVVTPKKKKADSGRKPDENSEEASFYSINKETHGWWKYETKQEAMAFFDVTKKLDSVLAEKLLVQSFPSDSAMTQFIDQLVAIGGNKPASNPVAAKLALAPMPTHPRPAAAMNVVDIASKRPKLTFASSKDKPPAMDADMKKFNDSMANRGTRLDVWHVVLTGSPFDAWGFSLKDDENYYWSWKPLVLEKAILNEQDNPLFQTEGKTMDEMLYYVRAATLRSTPGGPNLPSSFSLKTGKQMERTILFGLAQSPTTEDNIRSIMMGFTNQCKNRKVQMAYQIAMENTMKAESIKKDVQQYGPLWDKLAAATNNIVYTRLQSLSQVLMDDKIMEIICLTYQYSGGESPSMWPPHVFQLAFGDKQVTSYETQERA